MVKTKNKDKQSKTLGTISAINTLLEKYPVLTTTDSLLTNFSVNNSIGFLLSVLNALGVSQNDIIRWLCKILGDDTKSSDGLLNSIEEAIKGVLLVNVKDLLTCAINPNIPDNLMKYAQQNGRHETWNPLGITINMSVIDIFGLLYNCPSNEDGSVFYFDTFEDGKPKYKPNELYKSKDFNAFLWYIINKGDITNAVNTNKSTWDNRVSASKVYDKDELLKQRFFDPNPIPFGSKTGPDIRIEGETESVDKKQYIIVEYNEAFGGQIKVYLNADRYYRTRKIGKQGRLKMNRTIFEFNYDYIYSLKLFDTKTLLANITNSLLGLSSSISASFSFQQEYMKQKVGEIVRKIVESDETDNPEGYFTFSNDEYNSMLEKTTKSYTGKYTTTDATYDPSFDEVFENLRALDGSEYVDIPQEQRIVSLIDKMIDASMVQNNVENKYKFNFSVDFINDFLTQTITEIILQVLSPKVTILYCVNSSLMGNPNEIESIEKLLSQMENLIVSLVKQVKDIMIQALYDFMMNVLSDLLNLFISKLALETVRDYKDLITNLINNCVPNVPFNGFRGPVTIDNVNYADIVPKET